MSASDKPSATPPPLNPLITWDADIAVLLAVNEGAGATLNDAGDYEWDGTVSGTEDVDYAWSADEGGKLSLTNSYVALTTVSGGDVSHTDWEGRWRGLVTGEGEQSIVSSGKPVTVINTGALIVVIDRNADGSGEVLVRLKPSGEAVVTVTSETQAAGFFDALHDIAVVGGSAAGGIFIYADGELIGSDTESAGVDDPVIVKDGSFMRVMADGAATPVPTAGQLLYFEWLTGPLAEAVRALAAQDYALDIRRQSFPDALYPIVGPLATGTGFSVSMTADDDEAGTRSIRVQYRKIGAGSYTASDPCTAVSAGERATVELTGLDAQARYQFYVEESGAATGETWQAVGPADEYGNTANPTVTAVRTLDHEPLTVFVADTHFTPTILSESGQYATNARAVLEFLAGLGPQLLVHLGDLGADFGAWCDSSALLRELHWRSRNHLHDNIPGVPFLFADGNHSGGFPHGPDSASAAFWQAGGLKALRDYFANPTDETPTETEANFVPTGTIGPGDNRYDLLGFPAGDCCQVDLGPWADLWILNMYPRGHANYADNAARNTGPLVSGIGAAGYILGTPQKEWYLAAFAASNKRWKITGWHTGPGGVGTQLGKAYARMPASAMTLEGTEMAEIVATRADYLVNSYSIDAMGHDHCAAAEEFAPRQWQIKVPATSFNFNSAVLTPLGFGDERFFQNMLGALTARFGPQAVFNWYKLSGGTIGARPLYTLRLPRQAVRVSLHMGG